jgi:hypothetical protein
MRSNADTATRYQAHEKIDTFNAMRDYRKHWHPEGINIITEQDFNKLKAERDKLITHYGDNFNTDYGWAAKALSKEKAPRITFADILNESDLIYLRPLYKETNSHIHASSRGRFSKIGLPTGIDGILVGYSLFGIGWIARQTAFVMLVFLENLLMGYPTIENKINVEASYKLLDKIHNAWLVSEELLEKRASE